MHLQKKIKKIKFSRLGKPIIEYSAPIVTFLVLTSCVNGKIKTFSNKNLKPESPTPSPSPDPTASPSPDPTASPSPDPTQAPVTHAPVASDINFTVYQNDFYTGSFVATDPQNDSLTFSIVSQPTKGTVKIVGSTFVYKANAYASGSDTFTYRANDGTNDSNAASVQATFTPIASGVTNHLENYSSGTDFDLTGWTQFQSSFGIDSSTATRTFIADTYNSVANNARRFDFTATDTYAGNTFYNNTFGALPVDGAGGAMRDWAWIAEKIHVKECREDVIFNIKTKRTTTSASIMNLLINYKIDGQGSEQKLTGYNLLINAGGNSGTVSKFNDANEHATAFMDRWPGTNIGTEANANPVALGPYKGWDRFGGPWSAGGTFTLLTAQQNIFVRYQYNPGTSETTLSWEARPPNGVDGSPGSWDQTRTFTGADSLAPGGGFGVMLLQYNADGEFLPNYFVNLYEFQLNCTNP